MASIVKKLVTNKEILFNSYGQIFVKKRFIFKFLIKFFRYLPTK